MVRLQKYLADCGIDSRRKCEQYILEGKVAVNGTVVDTLGVKVSEDDAVLFEGKAVLPQNDYCYVMLHKPKGYVTTVHDPRNRKTVLDLVNDIPLRLVPVGRLDLNTSGLLLLSNDGGFVYRLTHPSHEVDKEYIAKIKGTPLEAELNQLRSGVPIETYRTSPAKVTLLHQADDISYVKVIIHEGRNRQVRKMFDAIGYQVIDLKRTSIGTLRLGNLKPGHYRHLTVDEQKRLMQG